MHSTGGMIMEILMSKVKGIFRDCVGHESYGALTEFYDEDGCVLLCTEEAENGEVTFLFPDGECFSATAGRVPVPA